MIRSRLIRTEFGLSITEDVKTKFFSYVAREVDNGRLRKAPTPEDALMQSFTYQLGQNERAIISEILGVKRPALLWCRRRRLSNTTDLYFLGCSDMVIELVSYRGLRQLIKKGLHIIAERAGIHGNESRRLQQIFKYKHIRGVQGALVCNGKRRVRPFPTEPGQLKRLRTEKRWSSDD